MFSIFSSKSPSYLGIDIGSASVKVVELESKDGSIYLKNYGFVEKMPNIEGGDAKDIDRSAHIIKEIYRQGGFTAKKVVAALHNFDVFTSVINLPKMQSDGKMEDIIRTEARKFVPIPLEDVVLDWKILNKPSIKTKDKNKIDSQGDREKFFLEEQDTTDVLLTAAPRRLVSRYVEIFQKARLNLLSLETESFALIRSLLNRDAPFSLMIIDIGAVATDIIIIEYDTPVVIRTVDVGGMAITAAIAGSLGIDLERAEQFKRDIGILSDQTAEQNNSIAQIIESAFAPVVNEISYSIDLYKTRDKSIEKIILSGGSAYMLGLADFLRQTFTLPVHIGDPWHKIIYPKPLESSLKELSSMFSVAIGLALKELGG
ncbi:MAG: type IV pilus assembly protein PilM [Candidatus Jacksonbacteria bacterium]